MTKPNLAFLPLLLIFSTGYSMEEQSSQEVFDPFHPTPEMLRELDGRSTRMHNAERVNAISSNPTNSGGVKKKRRTRNSNAFPSSSKKKCRRPRQPKLIDQYKSTTGFLVTTYSNFGHYEIAENSISRWGYFKETIQ